MIQYNTLNVKLSNSQLNKLKSGIKNRTEVTSNLIGNFNDETKFSHKFSLTSTQVSMIHKVFANGLSANIKFSKTQLSNIQSGGFMTDIFGISIVSDIKSGLDNFIESPFKLLNSYEKELSNTDTKKLNKNNYIDGGLNMIGKKINEKFGLGIALTNNEIKDIIKVIKSLENRGILLQGTT